MNTDQLRRLRKLLGRALELPETQREAFVREAAEGDRALEAELLALLASERRADPRLEPLIEFTLSEPVAFFEVGLVVGPWRLLSPLGRGGMGDVWLAERSDGAYEQRVAIKAPRAEISGSASFARFERERALLAGFEHPGVARLVDGGWSEPGRPWFAMEYVEGSSIDQHALERGLDARARVVLLAEVAKVLAAAHRARIVHRDLKPSNVLVRPDGRIVLVDFGIASVLGEPRGGTGSYLATPRYAAPEQLRGEPASTAADVYSLGLLARELLAPVLTPMDRDLDAVLTRATVEDPERRLPGAPAFAAELERWLAHLPVESRQPGMRHRLWLFARRNPAAAFASSALVATVFGALVATTHLWRAESAERSRAEAANAELSRRFTQVRGLVSELVFGVHDRIAALPGAVPVRAYLIERATSHLDELRPDAAENAALAADWIDTTLRLGEVRGARSLGNTGDLDGALGDTERALAMAERWAEAEPSAASFERLGRAARQAGDLLRARGDRAGARLAYTRADEAIAEGLARLLPGDAGRQRDLARNGAVLHLQWARLLLDGGNVPEGLARLDLARQQLDALAVEGDSTAVSDALHAMNQQAFALTELGRESQALELWTAALALADRGIAATPEHTKLHRQRLEIRLEHARVRALAGEAGAEAEFDGALAEVRELVRSDRGNLLVRRTLEWALLLGARLAAGLGDPDLAIQRYREAEPFLRQSHAALAADEDVRFDLAECLVGRAEAERRLGRAEGVEAAFDEGLSLLAPEAALARGEPRAGNLITTAYVGLAELCMARNDPTAARQRFEAYRRETAAWHARLPHLAWPPRHFAALEWGRGMAAEAEAKLPSVTAAQRIAHLDAARDAYTNAQRVVAELRDANRLSAAELGYLALYDLDLERVAAARAAVADAP
ncbi:MAG: protein kinase [Planctomycetaceae bacterium]|nr:protein kinase [Planctomycetaceae bacterium]